MAINVGGPAYTATNGTTYIADRYFTGGAVTDWSGASDVVNTNEDPIYLDERWGDFQYSIPLGAGSYDITLQFSEMNWQDSGSRNISATIENVNLLSDFDIYKAVGNGAALDISFSNIQVTDGFLTIQMRGSVDEATLSGIVVKRAALQPVAGGGSTDVQSPSAPLNLTASSVRNRQLTVSWGASSDNVGVKSYHIFRNGQQVGSVLGNVLSYVDMNLLPDTKYSYSVRAIDAAGNLSPLSAALAAKTYMVSGDVTLSWSRPSGRIDTSPLSIIEIGGYEIRYKLRGATSFKQALLPASSLADQNYITYKFQGLAAGDYDFEIATYDSNGVYSEFTKASF